MTVSDLHPTVFPAAGKRRSILIPYDEFVALREWPKDAEDLHDLKLAIKENEGQPSCKLDGVKRELGLN